MNYKSRIRSIERKLNIGNKGIDFKRLLESDYVYTGKCFDNIDRIYRDSGVINIPPLSEITGDQINILLKKRLLSIAGLTRFLAEAKEQMEDGCL